MAQEGDIVFTIGADVAGLTRGGQQGEKALADLEREAKTLERQLGKIGQAGVEFQRQMNALTGVTKDVAKSARDSAAAFDAFDRSRAQVDALRASIDPLFAASKRYEAALQQLDTALEQGAISARTHAQMTDQLAAAYLRADGASGAMGGRMGFLGNISEQTRGKIQQVGFQVQDFAVQVGAGTSATQAFAQQFPQLAGAFGPVGVAIGTLAAVGIPLLVAAFGSAKSASDEFSEAAKRQESRLDALSAATERLVLERQMLFSGAELSEEQATLNEITRLTEERASIQARLNQLVTTGGRAAAFAAEAKAQRDALQAELDRNQAAINALRQRRQELATAEKAKALAQQYKSLQQAIAQANISGPWAAVLGPIQRAIDKANEYRAAMENATPGNLARDGEDGRGGQREQRRSGGIARSEATMDRLFPSGGGGGGGGAESIADQLEQFEQTLMTQAEIEQESYDLRQAKLDEFLAAKLLSQSEYERMSAEMQKAHAEKMAEIDVWRYGSTLDKAEAFLGGMASALQGGNEKMLAISKKFAAAEALINAWQAFSQVLADKSLPFWAKIPSALKVLAAGMGAVNAIKGGGGGGGGASRGGSSAAATPAQAAPPVQRVLIDYNGPQAAMGSFQALVDMMNQAGKAGYVLNAQITGRS